MLESQLAYRTVYRQFPTIMKRYQQLVKCSWITEQVPTLTKLMASDHKTCLAFLTEKWSGENRTNQTGGAATVHVHVCTILSQIVAVSFTHQVLFYWKTVYATSKEKKGSSPIANQSFGTVIWYMYIAYSFRQRTIKRVEEQNWKFHACFSQPWERSAELNRFCHRIGKRCSL